MDQAIQYDQSNINQKVKPEDKKQEPPAEDPLMAKTIEGIHEQCQQKVNILLKHGKYELKDVAVSKKKVLNLRTYIDEMKQNMNKQKDEVMNVDEELRNGRPAARTKQDEKETKQTVISVDEGMPTTKTSVENHQGSPGRRSSMMKSNQNDELSMATKQLKKAMVMRKENEQ